MELMMLVPSSREQLNAEANSGAPCTEHSCRIPPEFDELKNVIEGEKLFTRARRWFRKKCLVTEKHPNTRFSLKSKSTISYEYTRQVTAHLYMIHPFSEFRIYWESTMILVTIFALLLFPFWITFYFELPKGEWMFIMTAVNCILMIDLILCFFTGYYELRTNVVVLDPKLVARKYITGWFLIDLLSSLPVDLLAGLLAPTLNNVQLYSYFHLPKIFRLRTVVIYGRHLRRVYKMSFQMHKSLEIMIVMVVVLHWAACAEYYISSSVRRMIIQSGKKHENWTTLPYLKDKNTFFMYIVSLYRASAALSTSLKHDVLVAAEDIAYDVILSIFGRIANIYLIAQWFQLMNTFRGTNNSYLRLLPQLREYMRHKELPIEIQNRLTSYYGYCTKRSIDLERTIMNQISAPLREELMLHRSQKLMEKVSFFKYLPKSVISRIATCLRTEVFLTNDIIIKAGTIGDSMYFIASGTVAIYTSLGKEVCHLQDGFHFGEISLIMDNELRIASVVAVEICELYVLARDDFQQAIEPYPNLMNSLQKLVLERLEKTFFLGDLYRLEGNIPEVFSQRRSKSSRKQKNKNWNYLYICVFLLLLLFFFSFFRNSETCVIILSFSFSLLSFRSR